jgi:hypothetical protein
MENPQVCEEDIRSEVINGVRYCVIGPSLFRKIWFETGGADLWDNATPEELAIAEQAKAQKSAEL